MLVGAYNGRVAQDHAAVLARSDLAFDPILGHRGKRGLCLGEALERAQFQAHVRTGFQRGQQHRRRPRWRVRQSLAPAAVFAAIDDNFRGIHRATAAIGRRRVLARRVARVGIAVLPAEVIPVVDVEGEHQTRIAFRKIRQPAVRRRARAAALAGVELHPLWRQFAAAQFARRRCGQRGATHERQSQPYQHANSPVVSDTDRMLAQPLSSNAATGARSLPGVQPARSERAANAGAFGFGVFSERSLDGATTMRFLPSRLACSKAWSAARTATSKP